jgi:hypothetical protein
MLRSEGTTGRASEGMAGKGRLRLIMALFALLACHGALLLAQNKPPAPPAQCARCSEGTSVIETEAETTPHSVDEVALETCDRLPMVKLKADGAEMYFLLDSAATSFANVKSFSSVKSKKVRISSWMGTNVTDSGEVRIAQLTISNHTLTDVRLPAVDLSAIGKACGHSIDGIFGVELIQQMGLTIDLQHQVGLLQGTVLDAKASYTEMEKQMQECDTAFKSGRPVELAECFDWDVVLFTSGGEFRGRKQVMDYLQQRYLRFAPNVDYKMEMHDVRLFGDALWYSYDYSIDTPQEHPRGHGMAMCRRTDGRWRIVNMQDSPLQIDH